MWPTLPNIALLRYNAGLIFFCYFWHKNYNILEFFAVVLFPIYNKIKNTLFWF